jgi:hypothetical protein
MLNLPALASRIDGLTFHRTFTLNRSAISTILENSGSSSADFRELTHLGTIYIEAMPRYARACGLLEFGSTELTPLGVHVLAHDPSLALPATQWLMHYHLCALHGPGPRFWHDLILHLPQAPQSFGRAEVEAEIVRSLKEASDRALKDNSIRSTATIFLGSYTKSDALGPLNLLQSAENGYTLEAAEAPPLGAFAYALSHHWQAELGDKQTCDLDDLSNEGSLGSLLLMSEFSVNRQLRQLARQQVLELWVTAPPYQVTRPPAPQYLLEGIYAADG